MLSLLFGRNDNLRVNIVWLIRITGEKEISEVISQGKWHRVGNYYIEGMDENGIWDYQKLCNVSRNMNLGETNPITGEKIVGSLLSDRPDLFAKSLNNYATEELMFRYDGDDLPVFSSEKIHNLMFKDKVYNLVFPSPKLTESIAHGLACAARHYNHS